MSVNQSPCGENLLPGRRHRVKAWNQADMVNEKSHAPEEDQPVDPLLIGPVGPPGT